MARKDAPAGGLERDFGYLFPFFEKITAAARAMPQGAGRARVEQLVAEERRRWEEIRALIGGQAPPEAVAAAPARSEPAPAPARVPIGGTAPAAAARSALRAGALGSTSSSTSRSPRTPAQGRTASSRGLTVGSLRPAR